MTLRRQTRRSTITGDVVEHYLRLASGKRGLTFCVDVETAEQTAEAFRQAGVPALMLHGGSSDAERVEGIEALKRGDVKMITNVDLFGEGSRLPLHRGGPYGPTDPVIWSLRPAVREGHETAGRQDPRHRDRRCRQRRDTRTAGQPTPVDPSGPRQGARDPDDIPVRACPSCLSVYRAFHTQCPTALQTCAGLAAPHRNWLMAIWKKPLLHDPV